MTEKTVVRGFGGEKGAVEDEKYRGNNATETAKLRFALLPCLLRYIKIYRKTGNFRFVSIYYNSPYIRTCLGLLSPN